MSLAALLFVGCGPSGNSFRLKGSIKGMESGEIYIYNTSMENARFDTLRLENGNFYYGGTVDEVTPYTLVYPNALEQVIFIGPGEEITYEAVSNDLNNYIAKGSDENNQMNAFRASVVNASYSDIQAAARRFLSEAPKSVVPLYIFERYFLTNSQTTYKELMELLDILRPEYKDETYFMALEAKAKSLKSIEPGDVFPDINMKDRRERNSNLWSSNSSTTYTMFLCWATWLPTSYEILAKVRQSARECPKGRMRYVAFSVDNEFDRWKNVTSFDSINSVEHYCDTRAFASPAIKSLGTSNIPTYYIIDNSNKKVIKKGTEPSSLASDLSIYGK